ncbi:MULTISPECIES: patatin-like phospholipase family protein [unclassified Nitratiruptor]|uniref:patatin-like phospholipase family protein n=1 Tax=unclassified Nitratiruptor TaxID=2624044 RepID=UPI00191576B8|nr:MULTISPECIES: patatin-like phospholipase family protein [unclassified Nitratiruptor]BCD61002.1 NTE family protein [Nitratiruptor sp. YY08-10]BCD64934.1 NTE family protein [Nitratiruptor sp. YY08-14]
MKKIALVLGSGGARGYAHIGAIEELQKHFEIIAISGASMGALIGGLWAAGKLDEYKKWVLGLSAFEVMKLLDFSFDKRGLVGGERVMKKLRQILGDIKIEELPVTYTAVATDLNKNREVWFQKGDLLEAIRASISIPSFFTPIEQDEMLLVDGGVLNPLPVAPTMATPADLTIAISLLGEEKDIKIKVPKKVEQKESELEGLVNEAIEKARSLFADRQKEYHLFDIMDMTIETMQKTLLNYRIGGYPPDILIEIPQNIGGTLDFHKAYEIIEIGRKKAKEVLKDIA